MSLALPPFHLRLRILLLVVMISSEFLVIVALWVGYIPNIVGFTTTVMNCWTYVPIHDFVIVY
jgi:hypothetical protein